MADPIEILTAKVDALAKAMSEGFVRVDVRFDGVDGRLDAHDKRFDDVDAHFDELRRYIDFGHQGLKAEIGRVERKLDQVIDSQLRG